VKNGYEGVSPFSILKRGVTPSWRKAPIASSFHSIPFSFFKEVPFSKKV